MTKRFVLAVGLIAGLSGCMTQNPHTGEEETSKATMGSIIGAVAGAAVGAAANHDDRGKGALIGAAAGAAAGGGVGYYMDRQEAELRHKLEGTGVRVKRDGDQINLVMPGDITFDVNESAVRDDFVGVLDSVAVVLKEYDDTAIQIDGHTDSTGSREYNQRLSEARATAVRDVLLANDIQIARTQVTGYGETKPIANNYSDKGRAENRRVNLKLIPLTASQ